MRGPCTAGPTRCGSGWWTSTARWPPAAIPHRSISCSRCATSSAPGTPAAGDCPGIPPGATGRTDRDPDLVLGIEELSAAYLGGVSLATLQAAGRVTEVSPGAVTLASTAFSWPVTPWCPDEF